MSSTARRASRTWLGCASTRATTARVRPRREGPSRPSRPRSMRTRRCPTHPWEARSIHPRVLRGHRRSAFRRGRWRSPRRPRVRGSSQRAGSRRPPSRRPERGRSPSPFGRWCHSRLDPFAFHRSGTFGLVLVSASKRFALTIRRQTSATDAEQDRRTRAAALGQAAPGRAGSRSRTYPVRSSGGDICGATGGGSKAPRIARPWGGAPRCRMPL